MEKHRESEKSSLEELSGRLREQEETQREEGAEFLARHWQPLLIVATLILSAVWIATQFQVTKEKKLEEASQTFSEMIRYASELKSFDVSAGSEAPSIDGENAAESDGVQTQDGEGEGTEADAGKRERELRSLRTAFQDSLSVLRETYSDSTYTALSSVMVPLSSELEGDPEKALASYQSLASKVYQLGSGTAPASRPEIDFEQRLASEIAALRLIRMKEYPSSSERLKDFLGLAASSDVVAAEALLAALVIAKDSEELTKVQNTANSVTARLPFVRNSILSDFNRFGLEL